MTTPHGSNHRSSRSLRASSAITGLLISIVSYLGAALLSVRVDENGIARTWIDMPGRSLEHHFFVVLVASCVLAMGATVLLRSGKALRVEFLLAHAAFPIACCLLDRDGSHSLLPVEIAFYLAIAGGSLCASWIASCFSKGARRQS